MISDRKESSRNWNCCSFKVFIKNHPDLALTEPTVRRAKNRYIEELKKRPRNSSFEFSELQELPTRKRGKSLLIGEELDRQVRIYLNVVRERGGVVNTAIIIAVGTDIVMKDRKFMAYGGEDVVLSKDWAKYVLHRMGLVKYRSSTKAKVDVNNFEELKKQYLLDINNVIQMDEISAELVINFDRTAINYVPVSCWTMEKEGNKHVEIIGKDKCQITAVLAGTLNGDFLPVQIVYKGTTKCCLPAIKFPEDWDINYSQNHWCNEETMMDYFNKVFFPYYAKKQRELKLAPDYPGLVIFNNFNGQCTEEILKLIDENHIYVIIIPANYTDRLQPMDLAVNKALKDFLRSQFQKWYVEEVCSLLDEGSVQLIDLRLSIMKLLDARWMVNGFDYIKSNPDIVKNGFSSGGIC